MKNLNQKIKNVNLSQKFDQLTKNINQNKNPFKNKSYNLNQNSLTNDIYDENNNTLDMHFKDSFTKEEFEKNAGTIPIP